MIPANGTQLQIIMKITHFQLYIHLSDLLDKF